MDENNNFSRWITSPPAVAILTLFVARVMGNPAYAHEVERSIWYLTGLMFVILTVLYSVFIVRGFMSGLLPLNLLAQGILLCSVSVSLGARMFQWVGVVMASSGASILAVQYWRRSGHTAAPPAAAAPSAASDMVSSIPLPFAITDHSGFILAISDAMADALGSTRQDALGDNITVLMNPGESSVISKGKEWLITQKGLEGGKHYFMLEEKKDEPLYPGMSSSSDPFIDPLTQLHTTAYAMRRLEEEIYRSRRYGHPLTCALMRFLFTQAAERHSDRRVAFNTFCASVRSNLRQSDTAAMFGENDVLMVLPECPSASSDEVIQKVVNIIPEVSEKYPVLQDAAPLYVAITFENGREIPSAKALLEGLNKDMNQKYTLTPQP